MDNHSKLAKTEKEQLAKKPYQTPRVEIFGNIREITQSMGGTRGKNDGGAGPDKSLP